MSDKTIIPFPSKGADPDLAEVQKPDRAYCRHRHIVICEKTRTMECSNCGSLLDPLDWALRWANKNSAEMRGLIQMRKERKSLHASIEALQKEERNTKARLKNARASLEKVKVTARDVDMAKESLRLFREGEA